MALDTVQDYIDEARVLLQDKDTPFRYSDAELIRILNIAIMEARRLRPDIFLGKMHITLQSYTAVGNAVDLEPMYRPAFVYYMVGRAELRDAEHTQDSRAAALMNKFVSQMLVLQS